LVLVSFADSTFGHFGTIYKASNWKQLHVTKPDYHYISQEGFVIHKKTLYDHAQKMGKSESDYVNQFGYMKVFGKSKTKFVLTRD
jgi:asparagine synthetase A